MKTMRFCLIAEMPCPDCNRQIFIGENEETEHCCIMHIEPSCHGFDTAKPVEYLEKCVADLNLQVN